MPFVSDDVYDAELAEREKILLDFPTVSHFQTSPLYAKSQDHMDFAKDIDDSIRVHKNDSIVKKNTGPFAPSRLDRLTKGDTESLGILGLHVSPTLDEQRNWARLSQHVNKREMQDRVLLEAAEQVLLVDKSLDALSSSEVQSIILLPKYSALMPEEVRDEGSSERRLSVKSQFFPSLPEFNQRASRIARFLRVVSGVWPDARLALSQILAANDNEDDIRGAVWRWSIAIFIRLLRQGELKVEVLIRRFLFEFPSTADDHTDESDEDDDDDPEVGEVGASNFVPSAERLKSPRVTTGSKLRRICIAILHGLKCALIHKLAAKTLTEHIDIKPFMEDLVKSSNAADLAHLASRFATISEQQSTPSRNDAHYLKDEQGRMVMRLEQNVLLSADHHQYADTLS